MLMMDLNEKKDMNVQAQAVSARTPRQKRERRRSIAIVFFAMLSFLAMLGCLVIFCYLKLENNKLKEQVVEATQDGTVAYTQEELAALMEEARAEGSEATKQAYLEDLKELMLSGNGTVPMLRYFFPEQIVFSADGGYHFYDIDEQLAKHNYLTENLVIGENGIYEYMENGQKVSRKGIDVSSFQGVIDWQAVAADGVEFAIIRMGIRGYGTGKLVVDEQFEANIAGALAAGLDVGVYFFTAAVNEAEAIEEAEFLIAAMEPYGIQCTVVLDIEDVNSDSSRTNGLTKEQWTNNTVAFCERVKQAGYTPMIYGNMQSFMLMLDMTRLEEYDKWFAAYTSYFYFPYDFEIWQYSDSGTVAGIESAVDLNISFYDWSSQGR